MTNLSHISHKLQANFSSLDSARHNGLTTNHVNELKSLANPGQKIIENNFNIGMLAELALQFKHKKTSLKSPNPKGCSFMNNTQSYTNNFKASKYMYQNYTNSAQYQAKSSPEENPNINGILPITSNELKSLQSNTVQKDENNLLKASEKEARRVRWSKLLNDERHLSRLASRIFRRKRNGKIAREVFDLLLRETDKATFIAEISIPAMAAALGCSERHIKSGTKLCHDEGLAIKKQTGFNKVNAYMVNFDLLEYISSNPLDTLDGNTVFTLNYRKLKVRNIDKLFVVKKEEEEPKLPSNWIEPYPLPPDIEFSEEQTQGICQKHKITPEQERKAFQTWKALNLAMGNKRFKWFESYEGFCNNRTWDFKTAYQKKTFNRQSSIDKCLATMKETLDRRGVEQKRFKKTNAFMALPNDIMKVEIEKLRHTARIQPRSSGINSPTMSLDQQAKMIANFIKIK